MKKRMNLNLLLATLLAVGLMIIPIVIGVISWNIEQEMQDVREEMQMILTEDYGDHVGSDEYTMESTDYSSGSYIMMFVYVLFFIIGGYALLVFLFALIAWMILRQNSKRLMMYRLLMGVEYLLQAGVLYVMIDMLIDKFDIITLFLTILVLAGLLYSAINTYSKRMSQ